MNFKNIRLCETGKAAVPVRAISSNFRWCRIIHVHLHVLRETETCNTYRY